MTELGSGSGSSQDADDFSPALRELHALIGSELAVEFWRRDHFFGLKFSSRLDRVETLPESESVIVYFENGITLDLAPREQRFSREGPVIQLSVGSDLILEFSPEAAQDLGRSDQ